MTNPRPPEQPSDDWREQAKARCKAATEGPWQADNCGGSGVQYAIRHILDRPNAAWRIATIHDMASAGDKNEPSHKNAAFIAHARTDLPRALAELDKADERIVELEGKVERLTEYAEQRHVDACQHLVTIDRLAARVRELEEQLAEQERRDEADFVSGGTS